MQIQPKDTLYYQFFVICGINVSDGLICFVSRSSFVYEILHYNKVEPSVNDERISIYP